MTGGHVRECPSGRPSRSREMHVLAACVLVSITCVSNAVAKTQSTELPELTQPVNDFANVIDAGSEAELDRMIRALLAASGDTVVVATIPTVEPFADIRDYAVKLFENHGRGIGQKGKDNGLLVLLAVKERRVWNEVGYDLEGVITDGFAASVSREYMVPHFRNGDYGSGLREGVARLVQRIAEARNVSVDAAPSAPVAPAVDVVPRLGCSPVLLILFVLFIWYVNSRPRGFGRRRRRTWGAGPWSGWNSGVGGFGGGGFGGGGFGGGFGGGGGGFGGFGGGRSGGGGGGASW
jgi:uncharacterized protein